MGTHRLICHRDTPSRQISGIAVRLTRTAGGGLDLIYSVDGADLLGLPEEAQPARRDGLWQATCFELFVRTDGRQAYREFNFSPSREWAAYALTGYRESMEDLLLSSAPVIATDKQEPGFRLTAKLPPDAFTAEPVLIGLTAVIVEEGGLKSYWALAHPPGQPDFHHAACFVASLPAPKAP